LGLTNSISSTLSVNPKLSIIVKGNIKDIIYADRFRISQVLNNLLNNAVKYSPEGKDVIVKVTKSKNGNKVSVSVQDFGIGISAEEQKNLFKRFWRAPTVKKNIPGIGLGLYISSQIIKMHNGKIWLNSDKNKGSTFKFSIPVKAV
ncbi:MAG TPA: HAMP domain-containing sensor histidine kinase, partial [Mucilaginibacter sp.]|nr:HAMP domain-containing sensor histidine kinase [Mucilaginibacter sp.]